MAAPFDTILLSVPAWDLSLDANGNIAVATSPYSVAQDMSSQCRQWQGEYIYQQSDGVPLASILGESPSLALIKSDFAQAAGQVPGTSGAVCYITSVKDRNVSGQVQAQVAVPTGTTTVAAPITGEFAP